MKELRLLLVLVLCMISTSILFAQGFSYQSVIRNSNNDVIANTQISIKLSILQGSDTGSPIYEETHTPTTNSGGLVALEMGAGTVSMGDFGSIGWGNGPYFVRQEVDPAGGTNYTIDLTTPLLSVPMAKYAEKADTAEVARAIVSSSGGGSVSPLILPGTVMPYAGNKTANQLRGDGWLVCDGSSVAMSDYPDLHLAIGYIYGGSGQNFTLPNLNNKYPRGGNTPGPTGGNEMVQESFNIGVNNLPPHTHTIEPHTHEYYDSDLVRGDSGENIANNSNGSVDIASPTNTNGFNNMDRTTDPNTGGLETNATGNGVPVNLEIEVLDPYITMRYIIKY